MTNQTTPEFISLDEAAAMSQGLRITFVPGVQALYAEALKNICYVKGIPVIERCTRRWASTRKPVKTGKNGSMS